MSRENGDYFSDLFGIGVANRARCGFKPDVAAVFPADAVAEGANFTPLQDVFVGSV
jgi:hypothetical protein